jgi:hypothetical protein
MVESSWDMMLTTRQHLQSWLRVSGALPLIPLYAFVILTKTSPHSSQLHVLGLAVIFNVTDSRLLSQFHWLVYGCFIGHNELYKISLFFP